jgi:hypothetical protein
MTEDKLLNRNEYLATVLSIYLQMPETPFRTSPSDRERTCDLFQRQVPIRIVESALLLGSLRRIARPPESPRLAPVRSLAYFLPVVEELLANPFPEGYLDYLRYKLQKLSPDKSAIQNRLQSK